MATPDLLDRLQALPGVAAVAGEPGVHAVGGAVRDLLLGREPHEVDLVVEGDAVALARRLGGAVTAHPRFGTATVRLGEDVFDLTSARRERYPRPGALPEVELGATIDDDLRRRDFSVNALAVSLADGSLTAVPGALDDLQAGRLRVLHGGSFPDDPTRLLRLARYAGRLGFAPEGRTARLAAEAVRGGAVGTITPERMGAELRRLLREPQPAALLALPAGLGEALLGAGFRVDAELVRAAETLCPPDARADLAALGACVGEVDEVGGRLRRLGFEAHDAGVVGAVSRWGAVRLPATPGEADAILGRRPVEVAVVAAARGDDAARRWLETDRHRALAIDGDDLVAAGLAGRAVGVALRAARVAMLDGSAPDRSEQLSAALAAGRALNGDH